MMYKVRSAELAYVNNVFGETLFPNQVSQYRTQRNFPIIRWQVLKVPRLLSEEETQKEKAKEQIALNNQISTYQIEGMGDVNEEDEGFEVIRTQLEKENLKKINSKSV